MQRSARSLLRARRAGLARRAGSLYPRERAGPPSLRSAAEGGLRRAYIPPRALDSARLIPDTCIMHPRPRGSSARFFTLRPARICALVLATLGVQDRKDPKLDEISPIKHIDAIHLPVLLIHGEDDTVVPYDQSDDIYDALRKAHKQVEFVKLKDEDHWLSRGATRLRMLRRWLASCEGTIHRIRRSGPPRPDQLSESGAESRAVADRGVSSADASPRLGSP
jgi:pimeloyl-ACP methyl ester carboxylesterase